MNTQPPYLRVGPVAIHLHSRETSYKPTSPPNHLSSQQTLDVQGLIFLSPNDGTSIQELNEAIPSNVSSAPPLAVSSPVSPLSPSPSVASTPSPLTPSPVSNAGNQPSVSSPAPAPPSSSSVQQPDAQKGSTPGSQPLPAPTPTPLPTLPQVTKGYASSHTPALSLSSGVTAQQTSLPGPTTSPFPDPGLVESLSPTSTSSPETASPTIASNATNKNATSIIAGSVLAAILGIVLFVAVVTFFLRMRARRKAEEELSWDPEPNLGHLNDNDSFFDSSSLFQDPQGRIRPSDRPGPIIRLQQDSAGLQTRQSSYLATPELAHITGPLTVTNLMPGDVPLSANTSIFMASRPGSAQVTPRTDNSVPRFMRLQDGGLPVPWSRDTPEPIKGPPSRPKAWPSRFSAGSLKNVFSPSAPKSTQTDSLQPRTSAANVKTYYKLASSSNVQLPEPAKTVDRTWSGTIRSGITNAWSAMVGAPARPYEPPDNNLTPIPPRPNRRLSSKSGTSTPDSRSAPSSRSVTPSYSMEERRSSRLVTRAYSYGPSHETHYFDDTIEEEDEESDVGSLPFPGSSTPESAHGAASAITDHTSVPGVPQVPGDVVDRPSSVPRLPSIRPLSRALTLRSEGLITLPESDDGYRSAFNQMISQRKQEYDRHLAELEAVAAGETSRPVVSRASTTSLMTESTALSRESSVMDDDERRAKQMLRMRRKRAMALSASAVGSGRAPGSHRTRT